MPQLSAYQTQFQQRMRRALGQRLQAGRKARAYARLLAGALCDAQAAAEAVKQLNNDYGLSLPPATELVEVLAGKVGADLLSKIAAETDQAAEAVASARVPDSKEAALPARAAYGERAADVIVKPAEGKATKAKPGRKTTDPEEVIQATA